MRKSTIFSIAAIAALGLAGCSGSADKAESSDTQSAEQSSSTGSAGGDLTVLKVGASPSPHGQILRFVDENLAEEAGLKIEVVEYADYVQPNEALRSGDLDANFFQTVPYLESESEARGFDFVAGEGVHLEPLGIYSDKIEDIKDLKDGAKVGIINDPSNQARALKLLADQGLVELPESGEASVATVTPLRGIELVQVEGPTLVRALPDVDIAVINGNFAQEGGLSASEDALVVESPENNPAVNVLVWSADTDKADAIKKLEDLLHSDDVKTFIETTWTDGSVIPAF
ncbi:ABC transporter substrate-binding protein [Actinomycetaceae bacterium WB03_NA08]|uniref:Lipoprotein n=1 Tax=Scrofimicrobium canadense TaxID=2652290 RepID=A0A6N7W7V6_9ACTO|nr:MetQ/NlpA family ABC transporter substrate-binding protein [Scrofimicrobium canadense]MSS84218.1 ABC transporter substrate-binding protein [Scrofimicrobium canadense]